MALAKHIILYGTRAEQPDPAVEYDGVLYRVTDEDNIVEQCDGSTWVAIGAEAAGAVTALTGDVTATGPGSVAATIANDAVTNAKSANMAQATIKGRAAGAGTGDPTDLTGTQATAVLDAFTGDSGSGGVKGLVPAPSAGDAAADKFLKADGTWDVPEGAGGGSPGSGLESYTIRFEIENTAGDLDTGVQRTAVSVPLAGTITSWRLLADDDGDLELDVLKDTFANYPPTGSDSITNGAYPALSTAAKAEDADLTGSPAWDGALSAGDVLKVDVRSCSGIGYACLELTVTL